MASEDLVDFNLNTLRNFVSDYIFQFLSEDTPLTSELLFGTSSPTSTINDEEWDALLLASSDSYENPGPMKKHRLSLPAKAEPKAKLRTFASPKSKEEVEQARKTQYQRRPLMI
jgi:hypothetical protein